MRVLGNDLQTIGNEYAVANLKTAKHAERKTAEKCAVFFKALVCPPIFEITFILP